MIQVYVVVCCRALQCVAICCSILLHCRVLQPTNTLRRRRPRWLRCALQRIAVRYRCVLQHVAGWCIVMCCSLRKHCGGAGLDDSSVRCSVVQHVTVLYYSVLQPMYYSVLQHIYYSVLQPMYYSVVQPMYYSVLQHMYYSVLQPTNTIQHTHRHALSLSLSHTHTCAYRFRRVIRHRVSAHLLCICSQHICSICLLLIWLMYVWVNGRFMCTGTCVCVCVYTQLHAHIEECPQTYADTHMDANTHTSIHIHTCVHTYGHIHTYTHVFACVHMRCKSRESESEIHLWAREVSLQF